MVRQGHQPLSLCHEQSRAVGFFHIARLLRIHPGARHYPLPLEGFIACLHYRDYVPLSRREVGSPTGTLIYHAGRDDFRTDQYQNAGQPPHGVV